MPPKTITRTLELSAGPVVVRDTGGDGETVLCVHGLFVDGRLWDAVAAHLAAAGLRVVIPDLPLGAHKTAMRADAPLAPQDVANLLGEIVAELGLERVTLVGNDSGGAISQLAAAQQPAWLARLVLTPCDLYENFPPPAFAGLVPLARHARPLLTALMQPLRVGVIRRSPLFAGWLSKRGVDDEVLADLVAPFLNDPAVRRDAYKFTAGIDKQQLVRAAGELRLPVLVMWADGDRFFKRRFAERLAAEVPGARLERIEDSYAFTPIDQPERTAELIAEHVRAGAAAGAAPTGAAAGA